MTTRTSTSLSYARNALLTMRRSWDLLEHSRKEARVMSVSSLAHAPSTEMTIDFLRQSGGRRLGKR